MKSLAFLFAASCLAAIGPVHGQPARVADFGDKDFSASDLVRALAPSPATSQSRRTRGLSIDKEEPSDSTQDAPPEPAAGTAAAAVRVPPKQAAAPQPAQAPAPRKVSMQLQFGLASADLTADARRRLDVVAQALANPELEQTRFVISGHTDVSGNYEANLRLSKRRADAVKVYLVNAHDLAPERLKAVGRGPDDLLDEANPRSPANRRVQIAVAE